MNGDTVSLIERPYQEIVDDILTAILGGVVNEPIEFDVKEDRYPLARSGRAIRVVTGLVRRPDAAGIPRLQRHTFDPARDYALEIGAGTSAIVWERDGTRPEDETTFYVDYIPTEARSPLSDINVGSVTRTLGESIGREIATVYEQINQAYRSAFIDSATGTSLDLVVSVLDVHRKTKEFASGLVTFYRDPAAPNGDITIVEGTVLRTEKGDATFETAEMRTLQRGQARVDVPVRAADASRGNAGVQPAGSITTLARSIQGINRVTNTDPTVLGGEDESDEQLRARARAALRALGNATVLAILRAVADERATVVEVWDPNGPPTRRSSPGTVAVLVDAEPERFAAVRNAVERTRAAGVRSTVIAHYVYVTPRLTVKVGGNPTPEGQNKILDQVIAAMQEYVDALSAGDDANGKAMLAAVKKVSGVQDAAFVDVIAFLSDTERPGADAVVDAVIDALPSIPPTSDALRTALGAALADAMPLAPTGGRTPSRDQVKGPAGQRATDAEIAAGTFTVSATVGSEQWWIALDARRTDIALVKV